MKLFAGIYTGKFKIGQRVNTKDTYPTGIYYGTIVSILDGQEYNNAYGVHLDGEFYDDKTPSKTYFSETDLELEV